MTNHRKNTASDMSLHSIRAAIAWTGLIVGCAALSSCGGGDGSDNPITVLPAPSPSSTPIPTPTSTPTATPEGLEYGRSSAAVAANADGAYRAGATGRGVKIAVIDTGIAPQGSEFASRIDSGSGDMVGSRGLADANGHGTLVSSVALAARDGRGMHGLAFEATLLSYNVSQPDACTPILCRIDSTSVPRAIDAAVLAGARVINMSFGAEGADPELFEAVRRAAAAGVVMVVSAGNEPNGVEPRPLARAIAEAGAGLVIIAGGHGPGGQPFAGGNRAGNGAAAVAYLTALGMDVATTGPDGSLASYSGTSLATAAISGAVALIAQARPRLTGTQIVTLLLTNATDAGGPGRDAIYGNGILNLASVFGALGNGA